MHGRGRRTSILVPLSQSHTVYSQWRCDLAICIHVVHLYSKLPPAPCTPREAPRAGCDARARGPRRAAVHSEKHRNPFPSGPSWFGAAGASSWGSCWCSERHWILAHTGVPPLCYALVYPGRAFFEGSAPTTGPSLLPAHPRYRRGKEARDRPLAQQRAARLLDQLGVRGHALLRHPRPAVDRVPGRQPRDGGAPRVLEQVLDRHAAEAPFRAQPLGAFRSECLRCRERRFCVDQCSEAHI